MTTRWTALRFMIVQAVPHEHVNCTGFDTNDYVTNGKVLKDIGELLGSDLATYAHEVEREAGDVSTISELVSERKLTEGLKQDTTHAAILVPLRG